MFFPVYFKPKYTGTRPILDPYPMLLDVSLCGIGADAFASRHHGSNTMALVEIIEPRIAQGRS